MKAIHGFINTVRGFVAVYVAVEVKDQIYNAAPIVFKNLKKRFNYLKII